MVSVRQRGETRFRRLGDRAVVLGAGMSGLLTARVLADFYRQVTIVEQDELTADQLSRPGLPQASHAHVLLPRGATLLDELFPGLLTELRQAGAPVARGTDELHVDLGGHLLAPHRQDPSPSYGVSRHLVESTILRRVRDLPNVGFMDAHPAIALDSDSTSSGARVNGVWVACSAAVGGQTTVGADLVVAAIGDGTRVVTWLEGLGFPTPKEQRIDIDAMYASRRVRFAPGAVPDVLGVIVGPRPSCPAGLVALAQEDDQWVVTLAGFGGDHPRIEGDRWLAFAAKMAPPWFLSALSGSRPLGDIHTVRFPANQRRRYDKLESFPEGLLVTGDALASFNPIYGQGMTLAAIEAMVMRETMRGGSYDLARRFFATSSKPIGSAWRFAVGSDLTMPEHIVPGARSLPRRAVSAYVGGVRRRERGQRALPPPGPPRQGAS